MHIKKNWSKKKNEMAEKINMAAKSYLVFYQNPKFEVCRFENRENTRLRRTAGKT
jgi:hypothetical protein